MSIHSRITARFRIFALLILTVVGPIPIGCSEGPATADPAISEARKKALIEENETKSTRKGRDTSDLKSVKGRLYSK